MASALGTVLGRLREPRLRGSAGAMPRKGASEKLDSLHCRGDIVPVVEQLPGLLSVSRRAGRRAGLPRASPCTAYVATGWFPARLNTQDPRL